MLRALQCGSRRGFRVSKETSTIEEEIKKDLLKEKTFYELLEVPPTASSPQIRSAYLRLARLYHPDLTGKPSHDFSFITRAYQTLSDPHQRVIYDESLVPDSDYYTVKVGKWRVKLKYLFGVSVTLVLAALAVGERSTSDEENCPSSFRLKKIGTTDKEHSISEAEKPTEGVNWSKALKPASASPTNTQTDFKKSIFQRKPPDSPPLQPPPTAPPRHNTGKTTQRP